MTIESKVTANFNINIVQRPCHAWQIQIFIKILKILDEKKALFINSGLFLFYVFFLWLCAHYQDVFSRTKQKCIEMKLCWLVCSITGEKYIEMSLFTNANLILLDVRSTLLFSNLRRNVISATNNWMTETLSEIEEPLYASKVHMFIWINADRWLS